ncbi:hypothetical protein ASG22_16520 [Chryseobacterium sp. Leaf405]|nr:hypothetical protein ASG22_16520 [Chryseobacterium sp. Leaf405]
MHLYFNREFLLSKIDYPKRFRSEKLMKSSITVFFCILFFLLLFKPFGVSDPELKIHYFLTCLLHAAAPAIILFVYFSLFNHLNNNKTEISWTLLKEFLNIGILLVLIGIVSFLMRDLLYDNPQNWSWRYLYEEIRNCLIAGIFFYFFLRITSFYFESKKGSPAVIQFNPMIVPEVKADFKSDLFIRTNLKQDDFYLDIENLLFVKADGNYVELTRFADGQIINEVKRISLTQFENQLSSHVNFFRCHRAYLVNMLKIEKVSGNSQGYAVSLKGTDLKVPVSRKQTDSFNSCYQTLSNRNNT